MKTLYEGLTFITVLGTGHMAAEWRPEEMQYVIKQFMTGNGSIF